MPHELTEEEENVVISEPLKYAVFSPTGGLLAKVQTLMAVDAIKAYYPKKSRKLMKHLKI